VQPETSTTYFISVTDSDGCSKEDSVHIDVIPMVQVNWDYDFTTDCLSRPSIHVRNLSEMKPNETFFFDFGDGTTSDEIEVTHAYARDSLYNVKIIGVRDFCAYEKSVQVPIYSLFVPNVFTPEGSSGFNDTFIVGFGDKGNTPADEGLKVSLSIVDRWGKQVFGSSDYRNHWGAHQIEGGVYFLELKLGQLATCKTWLHVVK
jgi:CHU_C Type IX secretion signal domain